MIAQLVKTALGRSGHSVETCDDGQEVLHKFYEGDFTLLILNLLLPRKSGLDIIRELRSQKEKVPVVLMCSHAFEGSFREEEGVALLRKPFGISDLLSAVEQARPAQ